MDGYSEIAPVWVARTEAVDGDGFHGVFATADAAKKYFAVVWPIRDIEWTQDIDGDWIAYDKNGIDTHVIQKLNVLSENEVG